MTRLALARHIERHPPTPIEIEDRTDPRHVHRRTARLLFVTRTGLPLLRSNWGLGPAAASVVL